MSVFPLELQGHRKGQLPGRGQAPLSSIGFLLDPPHRPKEEMRSPFAPMASQADSQEISPKNLYLRAPNPTPCHYISHGPLLHLYAHRAVAWRRGGVPKNVVARGGGGGGMGPWGGPAPRT